MAENPENQADGFRDDGAADAFNPPAAFRPPGPSGYFHAQLLEAAKAKNWSEMQRLLDAQPAQNTAYNNTTAPAFRLAAQAGELKIVEAFFARGFNLIADEGAETLKELVAFYAPASLPVVDFLVRNGHADAAEAVRHVAEKGTPAIMEKLREAGADISAGDSFSLAFYAGNLPMMTYLFQRDANIYSASVVAGLHGRREAFRARFGGPATPDVTEHYQGLLKRDVQNWELYHAYICPNHPTLDDFRQVPYGVKEQGLTLLHLAARTGNIAELIVAADASEKDFLSAADLLVKDKNGVSPLAILAARGEEGCLFDPRLWHNNPSGLREINEALKDLSSAYPVPPQMDLELQLYHLRKKADPKRWSLTPPRKK
ncbi:MAG TPA: hypothetical protein VEF76_12475 [Patescibacteria group bacterium]|nr:hypothetical protein [Patescibacteria group bacterium]